MIGVQHNPRIYVLSQEDLRVMAEFLGIRSNEFGRKLKMITPPPELKAMISPSEYEVNTLGGLLTIPQQQQPALGPAPTPTLVPQPTPPVSVPTPAASIPAPTPPSHSGPSPSASSIWPQRRNAISAEATGNGASPSHPTPPPMISAPTPTPPPGAPSPPKARTGVRPRAPPRRKGTNAKPANTPTPGAEPPSTPTPTPLPAPGIKRPLEEAETPAASQPEAPATKRIKVETPTPIKPPTPPPQISQPIERASIHTAEDATKVLDESIKRAEEQELAAQSQGQEPQDLLQWMSQYLTNVNPSAGLNNLPSNGTDTLVQMANETDPLGEGADIDFFDWGLYTSEGDNTNIPELDKHGTVSPESHNDVTTTPPSQITGPGRHTTHASTLPGQAATTNLLTMNKTEPLADDFLLGDMSLLQSAFSYDGPVDQLEEPWAIVPA